MVFSDGFDGLYAKSVFGAFDIRAEGIQTFRGGVYIVIRIRAENLTFAVSQGGTDQISVCFGF